MRDLNVVYPELRVLNRAVAELKPYARATRDANVATAHEPDRWTGKRVHTEEPLTAFHVLTHASRKAWAATLLFADGRISRHRAVATVGMRRTGGRVRRSLPLAVIRQSQPSPGSRFPSSQRSGASIVPLPHV